MTVVILPEAASDLDNGFVFYEKMGEGVGGYFLGSLASDIRSLRLFGGVHQFSGGYFRMVATRFPYAIYYKVEAAEVRVYAVIDTRRDPERLSGRLN